MISDYPWPSNRGTSPPSYRSSDPLKPHLAKPSLLPSNGITNAPAAKVANSVSCSCAFCNRLLDRPPHDQRTDPPPSPPSQYRDEPGVPKALSLTTGCGAAPVLRHGDRPCVIVRPGKRVPPSHFPLAPSVSSPSLSSGGKMTGKKAHGKGAKKASKGRPVSRSKSARETILRHILPFHSSLHPAKRGCSAESLSPIFSLSPSSHHPVNDTNENALNTYYSYPLPVPPFSHSPETDDDLAAFSHDFSTLMSSLVSNGTADSLSLYFRSITTSWIGCYIVISTLRSLKHLCGTFFSLMAKARSKREILIKMHIWSLLQVCKHV